MKKLLFIIMWLTGTVIWAEQSNIKVTLEFVNNFAEYVNGLEDNAYSGISEDADGNTYYYNLNSKGKLDKKFEVCDQSGNVLFEAEYNNGKMVNKARLYKEDILYDDIIYDVTFDEKENTVHFELHSVNNRYAAEISYKDNLANGKYNSIDKIVFTDYSEYILFENGLPKPNNESIFTINELLDKSNSITGSVVYGDNSEIVNVKCQNGKKFSTKNLDILNKQKKTSVIEFNKYELKTTYYSLDIENICNKKL